MASVEATAGCESAPVVALVAHVDTALELPGANVKPRLHENYDGSPIHYPDNPSLVLDPSDFPKLKEKMSHTLITASGATLLGSDDKSGVAIIMALVHHLKRTPGLSHGPLRVCFTPDEEIGRGVTHLDVAQLGADVAYTIDGDDPGVIQFETFSANRADITIDGVSIHPGNAKGKMVNALRLAGEILQALPFEGCSPETTEGYEGFIHPVQIEGNQASARIYLIIRDFEIAGLEAKGEILKEICAKTEQAHLGASIDCTIVKQYRNMRYWLENDMRPVEIAQQAIESIGLNAISRPVRGGTDGSVLTERGLPTPNFFCGTQNAHGPLEWVSLQDMELSCKALVELLKLWSKEKRTDGDGIEVR